MIRSNNRSHSCIFTNVLAMLDLILDQIDSSNIYKLIGENQLYYAHRQLLKKMKEFRKNNFKTTSIAEKVRIESHKTAMKNLAKLFPNSSYQNLSNFTEKWNYESGVEGLLNDLRFRNIDFNDVSIIVDDEYHMNLVYSEKFSSVKTCQSGDVNNVNSMLLAIPDLIAYNFRILNENFMSNKIDKDFNEKQLLHPNFFNLNKEQYELVKLFRKNLLRDGEDDFYATYSFITSRSFHYVITYIIEISIYKTFDEFVEAKKELPERTNIRLLNIREFLYSSNNSFEREQVWRNESYLH